MEKTYNPKDHLYFGCYGSVVRARQPKGAIPLHTFETDNRVLQRFVHCVPHMKLLLAIGRALLLLWTKSVLRR